MDVNAPILKMREALPFFDHCDVLIARGADAAYAEIQLSQRQEFSQHLRHTHGEKLIERPQLVHEGTRFIKESHE